MISGEEDQVLKAFLKYWDLETVSGREAKSELVGRSMNHFWHTEICICNMVSYVEKACYLWQSNDMEQKYRS